MRPILFPLAALLACSNASAPNTGGVRSGTFHYAARTAAGWPLLIGELTIRELGDSSVTGRWNIQWAPGADTTTMVGPQVGSGTLIGRQIGTALFIDLNPGNADHNVTLQALPRPSGYAGTWDWITITGPRTSGRFEATDRR